MHTLPSLHTYLTVQGFFFVLLQQAFIDFAQRGIGFFQQVLYAFVGGGERGGFGQLLERGNGLQFGGQIVQTARLFGEYGGNDVLRIVVLQRKRSAVAGLFLLE